ncbi:hypothetical protein Pan216_21840 [Planctomycetes bacterium Pan216]|uniref:DUF4367 domain-containing protein n=1 Tax=Kolteria novifilia TaxID=2527975 RepID=A0A518B2W1_9BACT|nr:hypothetical protein Pan216_21840 [Planctomycetes bacterium Pan216]
MRDESRHAELEWEELHVDGQTMEISDPAPDDGLRILTCWREGTFVIIFSDLPREEMVAIALSLTPVQPQTD